MANGSDGTVRIDTRLDTKGFKKGMDELRIKAGETFARTLDSAVKVSAGIRSAFSKIGSAVSNIFKKLLVGSLLIFALSAQKIFAALRESIQEAIQLKGGDTQKNFEKLKNSFVELKASIAAAFLPLVEFAIPYIQKAVDWLIQMFNRIAMITAALTGQKTVMQVVVGSAAKLAKNTEKTKKAAEGALAAFDQINVLTQKTNESDALTPKVETQIVPVTDDALATAEKIKDKIQEIKDAILAIWNDPIGALKQFVYWDNWKRLGENAIKVVTDTLQIEFDLAKGGAEAAFRTAQVVGVEAALSISAAWKAGLGLVLFLVGSVVAAFKAAMELSVLAVGAVGSVLDFLADKFRAVFLTVQQIALTVVNTVIGFINTLIDAVTAAFNAITGLTGLVVQTPNVGGASASVPHLATGAVIPPNSKFMAVLGDQKGGTNVEAPLETIKQALSEVMQQGGGGDVTIYLDGEVIYRNQKRVGARHGKSLLAGGME
ncbi:MAG: hypothetical protein EHM33_00925 [Chloroflexi bacterium]|nr:MAG: hypothetical protein EHM33_00925 [Chloroflexota bacterium]